MGCVDRAIVPGSSDRHINLSLQYQSAWSVRLAKRIKEIYETRVRYDYRRVHVLLRRKDWKING